MNKAILVKTMTFLKQKPNVEFPGNPAVASVNTEDKGRRRRSQCVKNPLHVPSPATLFTASKTQKQPKCALTNKWVKKTMKNGLVQRIIR